MAVVDIDDFGAEPGGLGQGPDSTDAVQAAADSLISTGGAIVVPPRPYRCTRPISIPSHVSVVGYGDASQLLMDGDVGTNYTGPTLGGGLLQVYQGQWSGNPPYWGHTQFRDLRITGTNWPYTQVENWQSAAIDLSNWADGIVVRNVTFERLHGFAIHGRGYGSRLHISGNRFTYLGNSAVNTGIDNAIVTGNMLVRCEGVEITGRNTIVTHNSFDQCGAWVGATQANPVIAVGGNITPGGNYPGCVVQGNVIQDCTGGIVVAPNGTDSLIDANIIIRVRGMGILVTRGGFPGQEPHRTGITNNRLRSVGAAGAGTIYGIWASCGDDNNIQGNTLWLNHEDGWKGAVLGIRADGARPTVVNNVVSSPNITFGYMFRNAPGTLFHGNVFHGTAVRAVDTDDTVTRHTGPQLRL